MKQVFKFITLFFCSWVGIYSMLRVGKENISLTDFIFYMIVFILFMGGPAINYWSSVIDAAFDKEDSENLEE
jgi:hypothetical protein